MAGKLARRTKNLIRRTRGMVGRSPRCVNLTQTPNVEIIGYVEVNKNATTAYSRSKVHKGIFACPRTELDNGDLILDRGENDYYFVMDRKVEMYNGEDVYIDATMYRCDEVITIQRFNDGIRDTFGRVVIDAPEDVATDVRAMFNPQNFDTREQEDRLIADNKIRLCVHISTGVKVADRLITKNGDKYHVISIDNVSLQNLTLCTVDTDVR